MKANKLFVLTTAMVLTLTACGGGSKLTRAETIDKLETISKATPATQTRVTASVTKRGGSTTECQADEEGKYLHTKVHTAKTSSAEATDSEVYAKIGDASALTVLYTDTSGNKYFYQGNSSDFCSIVEKGIKAKVDAYVANSQGQAAYIEGYLKNGDSAMNANEKTEINSIEAGATPKGSYLLFQNEKYTSKGDDQLSMDWEAVYPKEGGKPEHIVYEWNDNLLTYTNTADSRPETYDYSAKIKGEMPSTSGYNTMSTIEAAVLIAAAVAI